MDHMGTEAMVVDSRLFETCQLGGTLGSRTLQSFLSRETQALHKISDLNQSWSNWRFGLFPGFFGRVGPKGTWAAVPSATITTSI